MWHEARKQEKAIREAMVNYRRRAERRREHYEKMRGDPFQLLRMHGNKCRLHLDPSADEKSPMIPWQGDAKNMISRYDVRIHLDIIPDYSKLPPHEPSSEDRKEAARCNYERYRSVVQNHFHGTSEQDALSRIAVDELFTGEPKRTGRDKKKSQARTAIAFKYDKQEAGEGGDSDIESQDERILAAYLREDEEEREKAFSSESEYEIDMDVDDFIPSQVDKLNVLALDYGVPAGSFSKSLRQEKSVLAQQREARIADIEKTVNAGKHSRKERRQLKDKKLSSRLPTPPSYAIRGSPSYESYGDHSGSSSRTSSPEVVGKVEYITEFGSTSADTARGGGAKDKVGGAKSRVRVKRWDVQPGDASLSRKPKKPSRSPSPHSRHRSMRRRSRSRSRERNRRYSQRSRTHSSRSRSRERWRRTSDYNRSSRRSHSNSPVHSKPHSRSRSRSPERRHSMRKSHSRSPIRRETRSKSRSRSRSYSPEEKKTYFPKPPEKKPVLGPAKPKGKVKLTPQEKLKKKMQAQLNKQVKTDKRAQKAKIEQKEAIKVERDEGLREQMKKMRDREDLDRYGRVRRSRSRSPLGLQDYYAPY